MKIAIHNSNDGFHSKWVKYCEENMILYKIVNCYAFDLIEQLKDCKALMWHFHQGNPKDIIFAKELIFALEQSGFKVFPNFSTAWHFDDKIGQKYLLEAIEAPLVPTWVFYDKFEAIHWINTTCFPKVIKLRGGAGSQNVNLVTDKINAKKLVHKAFGKGFPLYDAYGSMKERLRLYHLGKSNIRDLIKGLIRFIVPPLYASVGGRDKGYIYFQEFIPFNNCDVRIIVIDDKAFAIKRMVRVGDFRASGSGNILYDKDLFDKSTLKLAFELSNKLKTQCIAFDFVYQNQRPLVVEISYGFLPSVYVDCPGYWDHKLNWHEGKFDPYGWMVDGLLKEIKPKNVY